MSRRRRSSKKSGLSYVWQYMMKTFGVALVVFYTLLISLVLYTVFYEIAPAYYYHYNSYAIGGFIILLAVFLGFGIFFNFFMAVLTDPGNTKTLSLKDLHQYNHIEIKSSLNFEETKETADERDEHEELYPEEFGIKTCKRCSSIKPHRSHHCSICDKCVLKMDHHCPWINSCVGHYNQRYFLLMLLYLLVSVFVYTGLVVPLEFTRDFKEYNLLKSWASELCFPLCFTIGLVMIPFNGWNWFLAFTGQTTIEFWTRRAEKADPEVADPESPTSFGHPDKRRNLQDIFGTHSFLQIILPSIRGIRDGVNWEVIKPNATMKISIPL